VLLWGTPTSSREMTYVAEQDLVFFLPVKSKAGGKPANYCFDLRAICSRRAGRATHFARQAVAGKPTGTGRT